MTGKHKVAVVTDGACSLTPVQGPEFGLQVVPVYVNFGDQSFKSGVDLDAAEFYRMLRGSKALPSTSQPTAQDFIDAYTRLADEVDEIVTVVISHHMSATLQSAQKAREQFTKVPVHIVDSESAATGLGLMAIATARAAAEGKSGAEVEQFARQVRKTLNIMFTVDTLEYLRRGGRIGGATAFLGTALAIKPVLYVREGRIEPLGRVRTRRRALDHLLELVGEKVGAQEAHFAILHCDAEVEAGEFAQRLKANFNCAEVLTFEAGPVIATHAGPGTLGVAFYT